LIGEYEKYSTFREYCFKSHEIFVEKVRELEGTVKEFVTDDKVRSEIQEESSNLHKGMSESLNR
jgi:hypothetical protein